MACARRLEHDIFHRKTIWTKGNCMDPVKKTDLTLIVHSEDVQSVDVWIHLRMNASFVPFWIRICEIVLVSSVQNMRYCWRMWLECRIILLNCEEVVHSLFGRVLFSSDPKITSSRVCDVLSRWNSIQLELFRFQINRLALYLSLTILHALASISSRLRSRRIS